MLPKNKLRDRRLERLRIFEDEDMGAFKTNVMKRWGEEAVMKMNSESISLSGNPLKVEMVTT